MVEKENTNEINSQPFYLPELDILRFFAFFAVFVHHSFPYLPDAYQGKLAPFSEWIADTVLAGAFGVDLFFALSSYLISELLVREYEKMRRINAFGFYARRALRILPLYYVFVLSAIFVFPRFLSNESLNFPYNVGFLTIFANWTCAFFGYPNSVAAALWSISIEEQFYLIFPFLVMVFGVKRLKTLALVFLSVAMISRLLLVVFKVPHPGIWCNTFARLDPIAGGILLSVFMRSCRLKPIVKMSKRVLLGVFGICLYILAAKYLLTDFQAVGYKSLILFPTTAIASVLIIWAFISPHKINPKKYAALIYLGGISYGLYVFHLLGIRLSEIIIQKIGLTGATSIFWKAGTSLAITISLAMISYNFLEKPFLKLKKRFTFIQSRPA